MDQKRWFIVFLVLVCMIFTLGLLKKFSKISQGREEEGPPASEVPLNATSQNQPYINLLALPSLADNALPLAPPPSFCFDSPSPSEVSRQNSEFEELAKAYLDSAEREKSALNSGTIKKNSDNSGK